MSQLLGSPDPRDPALRAQSGGASTAAVPASQLLGSPDPHDPALRTQVVPQLVAFTAGGFDWSDAGIGAAAVLAVALVPSGLLVLARSDPRRPA